ncbi:hypothetical protein KKA17_08165 [bacterium]|nr:hypothetical protein [bacterium]
MQITDIKRPALIEPFFHLEIDFKNDYVEYISTTNHFMVTSHKHIIQNIYTHATKPQSHNIAMSLM